MKTKLNDRVVLESGQAWWKRIAQQADDPFTLDGYGRIAEAGGPALLAAMIADVRAKLHPLDGQIVLEVGCGAGAITAGLVQASAAVYGVDFAHPMLLHARRSGPDVRGFVGAQAAELPFASGTFDRVLCYSVFNNFPSLEFAADVTRELIRVTKPGGLVLIGQAPNLDRKEAWSTAYAKRFGGIAPSRARTALGSARQWLTRRLRSALSVIGREAPPALAFLYFRAEFFEKVVAAEGHHCEVLPAYNLLQGDGQPVMADFRLDIRITTASSVARQR